jgi:hypothetical protein
MLRVVIHALKQQAEAAAAVAASPVAAPTPAPSEEPAEATPVKKTKVKRAS